MTVFTLMNPNMTALGYSEDNMLQATSLDMRCNAALVRNSPKMVNIYKSPELKQLLGYETTVVYRKAGDNRYDKDKSAAAFFMERYNEAPNADVFHLHNEVGMPAGIGNYSLLCAKLAKELGKKVVAFNVETNYHPSKWMPFEAAMRELDALGMYTGVHLYLDNKPTHDEGGLEVLDYLASIGLKHVMITEFGYIQDIGDANHGYRGVLDDRYPAWLEQYVPKIVKYNWPAFLFSIDHWPDNEQGKASGFGTIDRQKVQQMCATLNARYKLKEPQVQPPVQPKPNTKGTLGTIRGLPGTSEYRNVRTAPGQTTPASDVGDIRVGTKLTMYPPQQPTNYPTWNYVEFGSTVGWVEWTGVTFDPDPVTGTNGKWYTADQILEINAHLDAVKAILGKGQESPQLGGTFPDA